jgi:hypothetical protein
MVSQLGCYIAKRKASARQQLQQLASGLEKESDDLWCCVGEGVGAEVLGDARDAG